MLLRLAARIPILVLSLLTACGEGGGAEPEAAIPPFAFELPGTVAALVYAPEGGMPPDMQDQLRDLEQSMPEVLTLRRTADCVYLQAKDLAVGYESLAASPNFRDACGGAGVEGPYFLYVDLEILTDAGNAWLVAEDPMLEQVAEVLPITDLRYLSARVQPRDGGWGVDGRLVTNGTASGPSGLLRNERGPESLFADPDDPMRFEAAFDTAGVQALMSDVIQQVGMVMSPLKQMAVFVTQFRPLIDCWSGRVSALGSAEGGPSLAFGVTDEDGMMDLLDRHLQERSGQVWVDNITGDIELRLRDGVLYFGEQAPPAAGGASKPWPDGGGAIALRMRTPDGAGLELGVRVEDAVLHFSAQIR